MKSIPALSKVMLALMIALPGTMPAYAASAEEAEVQQEEQAGGHAPEGQLEAEQQAAEQQAEQSAEEQPAEQSQALAEAAAGPLFEDDFQDGNLEGWTLNNSSIIKNADDSAAAGNKMLYVNAGDEALATIAAETGDDYVYEAKVKALGAGAYPGIYVRYKDANNYYLFQPQPKDKKFVISKKVNGTSTTLKEVGYPVEANKWYKMRFVVEGSSIKAYVDDALYFDVTDTALPTGKPGFRSRWEPSALDDVQVWNIPDPKPSAPGAVQASNVTATAATIGWESELEGATYRVYRSTSPTSGFAAVYSGTETSFVDTGLASGVTYYYQVAAEINKYEVKAETISVTTVLVLPESPDKLPGIVAAYSFDETSGTQAAPVNGSSNTGKATLAGGASWTAGRTGGAVDLNGTNGHVTLPAGIVKDLNDMTIATWVKQDTLKQWARVFDIGLGTNNYMFFTTATNGGESRFVLKNGGAEQIVGKSPAQQAANKWVHYAMTLSGNTAILYVDGVEVARNAGITLKPKDLGNTTLNYIGRSMFSADPYLDGKIDDFYVFNRALGPAEIALFTQTEDAGKAAADQAALTLPGDLSKVMSHLTLPVQGANGSSIFWQSDKPEFVDGTGKVTRPAFGEENAAVVLTATIKRGNVTLTKTFNLTVLAELSDADAVAVDQSVLTIGKTNQVTAKLTLPQTGANGTEISWKSDHETYLRPDGMVRRPAIGQGDLQVKLTASIKRGSATGTKVFDVTILEQDEFSAYLFAYNKMADGAEKLHYAVSRNGRNWTELGVSPELVTAIEGSDTFKLNSEDKWYKYTFTNGSWSLSSTKDTEGAWTQEAASFFTLPSGALAGSFKRINEAEWSRLVHGLSTPRTLNPLTVYTGKGFEPRLPELVKVDYTNNLYTTVAVEWAEVDPADYAAAGTFKADGTIKGTNTVIQATVKVEDRSSDPNLIRNGEFWFDDEGGMIQAHGGHIIKVEDTYYWFGEDKGHNSAVLNGVSVYASKDLKTWEFRNTVLTTASHPELASAKIERPKVVYNKKTSKYVLWGHWEEAGNYNQANVVVAVSDTVDGDYEYLYRFQPGGMQSRDFTVFQDDDGSAYLFSSSNNNADMNVFKLTDDYLYTEKFLYTLFPGGKRESPAIVKKDGIYYMFTSGLSGWYPNQGNYATTTSLTDKSKWSELKLFGDPATYYTQSSFILSVYGTEKTSYVYVGDRWNPTALMNSQYIWLPLQLDNGVAEISYAGDWDLNAQTGRFETSKDLLVSEGKPVAASAGTNPAAANDGNYLNYYEFGGTFPVTWRVDLGREYDLSRIDLSWREWNGSEVYVTYKIEGSNDDKNYDLLIDQSANRTTSFNSHKLKDKYRYVRVTILGQFGHTNNADRPVTWYTGLHEVKIYSSDMKLDTPQGITAMPFVTSVGAKEATNVNVKWNGVPNAAGYILYRSTEENGTYAEVYNGRANEFADHGLKVNQTYYYKVKAVHPGGESEISVTAAAKTFAVPGNLELYDNTVKMNWLDEEGNARIFPTLKAGSTYYYYQYESDANGFKQINVQTSQDGKTWSEKKVVLDRTSHPDLAACKFEGLYFTYNEATGNVVAWMHYENNKDYSLGRAASMSGDPGEALTFNGSFRPEGNDSRDITFFKDTDGKAYMISAGNTNSDLFMYELNAEYTDVVRQVAKIHEGQHREAPSMIVKDGYYYLFTSEAAGWYPSKAMYSSAPSVEGPWSELRPIGSTSTFSAQSGGVWTIEGTETTSSMMHANRWLHGWASGATGSTQRWLPIAFNNGYASYDYYNKVLFNRETGVVVPVQDGLLLSEGKPAYAQDWLDNGKASKVNDGDYYTNWVSANATWPKWWTVDLGDVYNLSNIQISWYLHKGSEGYPKYKIETSTDGVSFTTALDRTDNLDYGFTTDKLTGEARYVRVQLIDAKLHNNPTNWYTPQLGEVKVFGTPLDKTAPVTTAAAASEHPENGSGWYKSDVTLTLNAADDGAGVKLTEYRLNGGQWKVYDGPFIISDEGKSVIEFRSTDLAGNVEAVKTFTVNIDKTKPVLKLSPSKTVLGTPNHKMIPVHMSVSAEDGGSGVAGIKLVSITSNEPDDGEDDGNTTGDIQEAESGTDDVDFLLRAERSGTGNGRVYTITYSVTDLAGHETLGSAEVKVAK
ncbi:family 43 glycosylhydrolase [Paenibacillus sp. N4]|uniref:immunoglobulin-like domain-containing protein n=1 Tax=Paenibacillus vietnamensis TaxID=2590547 RepID=UPI001CD069F0|nr:immunoglobulin-like domain-containing protein [Paenibacillus vietnamensis]MCA0756932.1 family 43 glycosylhydrolase [Paenibacillus vietnamensis]